MKNSKFEIRDSKDLPREPRAIRSLNAFHPTLRSPRFSPFEFPLPSTP